MSRDRFRSKREPRGGSRLRGQRATAIAKMFVAKRRWFGLARLTRDNQPRAPSASALDTR